MSGWLHRRRYVKCGMCGTEFRKGKGEGVSRRVFCSFDCYVKAWQDLLRVLGPGKP